VTTEKDFEKMLDACPTDWDTRKIFADWLQDRDDPRAEGIRALAFYQEFPALDEATWFNRDQYTSSYKLPSGRKHHEGFLPKDWFDLIEGYDSRDREWWKDFSPKHKSGRSSRARAEDAAALAFAKLPEERRQELLQPVQQEQTA